VSDLRAEGSQSLQIRALGTLDLTGLDRAAALSVLAQPKRLVLLVYLAMAPPPYFRRRDTLVAQFWPELDEQHARGALRQALRFLRHALGADALVARGLDDVGVSRSLVRFDVHEFESAAAAGDCELALASYAGDLLDGVHVSGVAEALESWIGAERMRLRTMARDCARALADDARAQRNAPQATRWSRRAYALSEHDECDLVRVITALAESGDRSGAMREYDAYARELEDGLGVVPSAHARVVMEQIRGGALAMLDPIAAPLSSRAEALTIRTRTINATPAQSPTSPSPRVSRVTLATLLGGAMLAGTGLFVRLHASRLPLPTSESAAATTTTATTTTLDGALPPLSSTSVVAGEAYVRGQYLLSKRDTASIRQARDEFLSAIDADPAYADAWVGLAYAYGTFAHYGMLASSEAFARADEAARKALQLRPASGMARVLLASTLAHQEWRWEDGVRGMRDGIALDSLNADAHNLLGIVLRVQGRFDEALVEARLAARLDPLGRHYEYQIGHILLCAGRYSEALQTARRALSLSPPFRGGHVIAAKALFGLGRLRESLIERNLELGDEPAAQRARDISESDARRALDSLSSKVASAHVLELERVPPTQFVSPVDRATAYAAVGNWTESFRWLNEARRVRDVNISKVTCNTDFRAVRRDPRFVAVMREVGLPADVRGRH
jgi:DNA-binding SARP family transcriptional activator/Tfp pilus assembly protein PilF